MNGTAIFVSSLFCFQVKLLPNQTSAIYDMHGLWSWLAWAMSAAGGEDPGARCEGKNGCPRAIATIQWYLQKGWEKQESLGKASSVTMAVWERDGPTCDAVQGGWVGVILGMSQMNVQRMQCSMLRCGFQHWFVWMCANMGVGVRCIQDSRRDTSLLPVHTHWWTGDHLFSHILHRCCMLFPQFCSWLWGMVWPSVHPVFESMCFVLTDRPSADSLAQSRKWLTDSRRNMSFLEMWILPWMKELLCTAS